MTAGKEEGVAGLFSADALAYYSKPTGTLIEAPQVQNLTDKMVAANLIARPGHGIYAAADPFVRKVWLSRAAMALPATTSDAAPLAVPLPSADQL